MFLYLGRHVRLICLHLCLMYTYLCLLYICAWFGLVIALLLAFLINALISIKQKKGQINLSWLSAYFSAVVYNAVYNACLHNVVCCFN